KLEQIVIDIRNSGGQAAFMAVDVTDLVAVKALIGFAERTFSQVDVIFNNAGIMPLSPLSELKVDEWNRMIDINIRGVLYGIAAGLPLMQAQGRGHFINTASTRLNSSHVKISYAVF